jgi:hypothetical protein
VVSWASACGTAATEGPSDGGEWRLRPSVPVSLSSWTTPVEAASGQSIALAFRLLSEQATTVDVSYRVKAPSGSERATGRFGSVPLTAGLPGTVAGTLVVDASDSPGRYTVDVKVSRDGAVLVDAPEAAAFTVLGRETPGDAAPTDGGTKPDGDAEVDWGGPPRLATRVDIGGAAHAIDGTNVPRLKQQLILYTRLFDQTETPTNRWGAEVVVVGDRVSAITDRQPTDAPPVAIPPEGFVLSGHDTARDWLLAHATVGALVTLNGSPTADGGAPPSVDAGAPAPVDAGAPDPGTADSAPMPYPSKAVAVYHMMWTSSDAPKLAALPASINVVNLAFAQGDPPRLVDWSAQGQASFIADAKALRARGVRVVLSVGGSGGNVTIANRQAFVDGVMAINAKVPLDGLDWDLEGPAMNQADVLWIAHELERLRGAAFAETMAPNGSNVGTYLPIAVALHREGLLDAFGQQYYDAVVSKEAAQGRIEEAIGRGLPEELITIGMMVGSANTYWTVEECVANVAWLKAKHPRLRGGYLWESGREGTTEWASQVGALLGQ